MTISSLVRPVAVGQNTKSNKISVGLPEDVLETPLLLIYSFIGDITKPGLLLTPVCKTLDNMQKFIN